MNALEHKIMFWMNFIQDWMSENYACFIRNFHKQHKINNNENRSITIKSF